MDVTITATPDTPLIGVDATPYLLDGPLSWAWWQRRGSARILPGHQPEDACLPLGRWEQDGVWGWRVSRAFPHAVAWTAVEMRRKPNLQAFARYTTDRRFHPGLGPHKARDITIQAIIADRIVWHADTTDQPALEDLLADVTHIGAHAAIGYGHIASWTIEPGPAGGWADRPMPDQGGTPQRVRPPYWHHDGRVPCSL